MQLIVLLFILIYYPSFSGRGT